MNHRIFALIGPHASGKASIVSKLVSVGINYIPLYTTANYHGRNQKAKFFLHMEPEEFSAEQFIIKVTYKDERYGIKRDDLLSALSQHELSVMILPAHGILQMKKLIKTNLVTVFLMCDYVTLVDRMLKMRHTNDEIKYHLQYAESNKEFDGWKQTNFVIKNSGDIDLAMKQLLALMGLVRLVDKDEFIELTK